MVPAVIRMMQTLQDMTESMRALQQAHVAGEIDFQADSSAFTGAYKQIIDGANASVQLHVTNVLKILTILQGYAQGDLTQQLERLPGKQIIANEILDLLRGNLQGVDQEIQRLIAAVCEGRLCERGRKTPLPAVGVPCRGRQ